MLVGVGPSMLTATFVCPCRCVRRSQIERAGGLSGKCTVSGRHSLVSFLFPIPFLILFIIIHVLLLSWTIPATLAVLHQDLGKAIEILSEAARASETPNPVLISAAMALAGFSKEDRSLWKDTCSLLRWVCLGVILEGASTSATPTKSVYVLRFRSQVESPYLRAVFGFLTSSYSAWKYVVEEEAIDYMDR